MKTSGNTIIEDILNKYHMLAGIQIDQYLHSVLMIHLLINPLTLELFIIFTNL